MRICSDGKILIDKHLKYDSMSAATSSQPCWSSSVSNRQWSNWAAAEDPVVGPNDDITTSSVTRYSSWLLGQQLSNGSRYSCAFDLQCFRRENKKYCIIYTLHSNFYIMLTLDSFCEFYSLFPLREREGP